MKDSFKNMFSLHGIWKKWREWFSLARNLICISWNKVCHTVTLATHKRRQLLMEISIRRKICSHTNKKIFHYSLPLEGVIGSTFRKKRKIKGMVLSKSIIGSHYKKLGFTWLFYCHFVEKCVILGQGFYSKLSCVHVLGRSQLFLPYG